MKKKKGFLGRLFEKKENEVVELKMSLEEVKPLFDLPAPPKTMSIDEVEDKNVRKVIENFDFEKVRSIMIISKRNFYPVPTIDEMKARAKRLLLMCLEHKDREFWWAGGMMHGGLCACWNENWGLSLIYVGGVSRVKIEKLD